MDADDQARREKEIFEQALDAASAAERLAFLRGACGADAALLARVQVLLQAHETAREFLPGEPAGQTIPGGMDEKPGDRIGRYKLREKIGEGGCGVVYVAEQEEPVRRKVALKVIKLGMDTKQVIARFEAERQALAMMDHPHIAKVLDAGATDTGRPYFVMELVRGIRITDYCDQNNLPTQERLNLFIKVCQAIQHAHQKGIIHRDIKPSNILVTLHDGVPVPKVIDFGIAKATEGRLADATVYTQLHQFIGTPAYMSPEQAEMSGLDIDTRSDIYGLGVLLYELLTGCTPFDPKELMASGIDAMRKTIREEEPLRPSTRLTEELRAEEATPRRATDGLAIPTQGEISAGSRRRLRLKEQIARIRGDLDWIVMKCLEKDRSRRYETANGLAADLKRHLNNEPVVARPPSAAYRLQKACRRNRLAFTAGAVIAAAFVAGTTVSTWQAIQASRARNAEKRQRVAAQTERDKALTERHKARAAQRAAENAQQAEKEARLRADAEKAEAGRLLYAADMNLAQRAWEENDPGRLRQLLEETQDYPDRGFEWYFWQPKAHLALQTLRGHLDPVRSVAFSPDGLRVVTGSDDHTAKVWEAASGRERVTLTGHNAEISSVAFSPDGQRIVTGSVDRTARVWESSQRPEDPHAPGAQRLHFLCGLFPGRPADCYRQL
jgi:serine/threonine protein kinase